MPPKRGRRGRGVRGEGSRANIVKYDSHLPPCDGPKLLPFAGRYGPVEFIRLLSDPERDSMAYVFEVTIAAKRYALKIVSNIPSIPTHLWVQ